VPKGPSGYAPVPVRETVKQEYTHDPPPSIPSHDAPYRFVPAGAAAQAIALKQDAAAYEARRRARMAGLNSSPTPSEFAHSRSTAPAPQTYARAVAEPRGYREDPYARPSTSEYRPHEHTSAPAPAPAVAAAPAPAALIDPATVLATLDVLKAQIANLERLLPAALPALAVAQPPPPPPPPVQVPRGYGYDYERDHRPPPAPPRGHEYGQPPPLPPQRGYVYDKPPPPPQHPHHGSPPRELHAQVGTEPWANRAPPRRERGGPYKERGGGGYKGREDYRAERHDDHDHGHGHGHGNERGRGRGHGERGSRGRGGRGGRGDGRARGRGGGRGGR
jgi:hypothetical protein